MQKCSRDKATLIGRRAMKHSIFTATNVGGVAERDNVKAPSPGRMDGSALRSNRDVSGLKEAPRRCVHVLTPGT